MAVRYTRRGSGITRRPVLALSGTGRDIGATLRRAADTRTFEGISREIEEWARTILKEAGIDPDHRQCEKVADDSPEDYCDRVLTWIDHARHARSTNDFDNYGRAVYVVGMLVSEYNLKTDWETPALAGKKSLEGATAGGKLRSRTLKNSNKERDLKMAEEFQKLRSRSRLSDSALKEKIGQRFDLGRSAAIARIDRGLKLLSTVRGKVDS